MRISRFAFLLLLLSLTLPAIGAAAQGERAAADILRGLGDEACALANEYRFVGEVHCSTAGLRRIPLAEGVAHYTFNVRVGASKHAVLTLHRIVREQAPFEPAPGRASIFLVQADRAGFAAAFLTAPAKSPPRGQLPVYLAQHGIDVWGADFRRYLEPTPAAGLADLEPWGLTTDVEDLGVALLLARTNRFFTGGGFGTLQLAGDAEGLGTHYLEGETERPRWLRHVDSFLPLEVLGPPAPELLRLAARGVGEVALGGGK